MLGWTFNTIWHFIASSASVTTLIGGAAVAVAVLVPPIIAAVIPDLRKWAIAVAVVAFSYTFIAGKFYADGIAVKQAEWDAALARETENGEQARSDAESTVHALPPDSVRNDPRNRDNWGKQPEGGAKGKVRWLESTGLFGKQRHP